MSWRHCELHTAHCTLFTAHCTLHTAHCTLHLKLSLTTIKYKVAPCRRLSVSSAGMGRYDSPGTGAPGGRVGPAPLQRCRPAGKSSLRNPIGQMPTALGKGQEWLGSITNTPGHLRTELPHSPQPVAEMAALLLMSKMKNMP
jgi:hypothetical protein